MGPEKFKKGQILMVFFPSGYSVFTATSIQYYVCDTDLKRQLYLALNSYMQLGLLLFFLFISLKLLFIAAL